MDLVKQKLLDLYPPSSDQQPTYRNQCLPVKPSHHDKQNFNQIQIDDIQRRKNFQDNLKKLKNQFSSISNNHIQLEQKRSNLIIKRNCIQKQLSEIDRFIQSDQNDYQVDKLKDTNSQLQNQVYQLKIKNKALEQQAMYLKDKANSQQNIQNIILQLHQKANYLAIQTGKLNKKQQQLANRQNALRQREEAVITKESLLNQKISENDMKESREREFCLFAEGWAMKAQESAQQARKILQQVKIIKNINV